MACGVEQWEKAMTSFSFQQAIAQKIQQAVSLHQSSQLAQAERLYREVLSIDANHVDALHLLGLVACAARHYGPSEELIRRAIALAAGSAATALQPGPDAACGRQVAGGGRCIASGDCTQAGFGGSTRQSGRRFSCTVQGGTRTRFRHCKTRWSSRPASPEIRVNLALALAGGRAARRSHRGRVAD